MDRINTCEFWKIFGERVASYLDRDTKLHFPIYIPQFSSELQFA